MILKNHIVYRFLTDESIHWEVVDLMHHDAIPAFRKFAATLDDDQKVTVNDFPEDVQRIGILLIFLDWKNNMNYYITETVLVKLSMLKVKRKENGYYDWSVFSHIHDCKKTFIFPNNSFLRLNIDSKYIHFIFVTFDFDKGDNNHGQMNVHTFYADRTTGLQTSDNNYHNISKIDEFIFRIMCFFFLTENDELVVSAGAKHGTRKEGKLVNSLPFPVTLVNSRWNTTVIRTEGFPVSGHFRIQPCGPNNSEHKLIFIEPFQKHGYIRKAPSL